MGGDEGLERENRGSRKGDGEGVLVVSEVEELFGVEG